MHNTYILYVRNLQISSDDKSTKIISSQTDKIYISSSRVITSLIWTFFYSWTSNSTYLFYLSLILFKLYFLE